jgi:hypothetical protein
MSHEMDLAFDDMHGKFRPKSGPKTNHTCHQKPNPSRETVPLRIMNEYRRQTPKTRIYHPHSPFILHPPPPPSASCQAFYTAWIWLESRKKRPYIDVGYSAVPSWIFLCKIFAGRFDKFSYSLKKVSGPRLLNVDCLRMRVRHEGENFLIL